MYLKFRHMLGADALYDWKCTIQKAISEMCGTMLLVFAITLTSTGDGSSSGCVAGSQVQGGLVAGLTLASCVQ